jgi:hypothetical protein
MFGEAIGKVCARLKSDGIDMRKLSALDFFAREGDWQTVVYAREVGVLEAWEINSQFQAGLQRNLPGAKVRIVDSYVYGAQTKDRFDFLVLDNPQATFGPNGRYCEHFEALPIALRLLKPRAFLIFNLNWAPFNFEMQAEWQRRRAEFYGVEDTSSLSLECFLLPFYQTYFEEHGFEVIQRFVQPRNNEYLAYAIFQLQPKDL